MREITGNLLDQKGILVHQVNCQRVAGAGLALAIRNKWPAWYEDFHQYQAQLGEVRLFNVAPNTWVASFYAQRDFGTHRRQTQYGAFRQCCYNLALLIPTDSSIFFPYRIGCGLAGGDWTTVQSIIADFFQNATIVRLP